jgi:hypothetical protein
LDILRYESEKQFKEWAVNVDLSKGLANGARVAGWASSVFVVIPGAQGVAGVFAGASLVLGASSVVVERVQTGSWNEANGAGSIHSGALSIVQSKVVPILPKYYQVPAMIGFNAYDRVTSEMFGIAGSN